MTEYAQLDTRKIFDAVKCVRQILQCTFCKKLPKDASAAKCGHPFCDGCVEKILCSKKPVCSICKTVLTRSNVIKIRDINRTIKDLETLTDAIVRDSGDDSTSLLLLDRSADDLRTVRQYKGKRRSIEAQPSTSKEDILPSETSMPKPKKTYRRNSGANKPARRRTTDSEETLKIYSTRSKSKNYGPGSAEPGTSNTSNSESGIFERREAKIPAEVRATEPIEKVSLWLNFKQSDPASPIGYDFPEIEQQHVTTHVTEITENLEACSQTRPSSTSMSLKSRSKSPLLSNKSRVSKHSIQEKQDDESSRKFKSFTFEMKNKSQNPNAKAVAPAEKMFDELRMKKSESKKSSVVGNSTEGSWSELAQFRKETRPKIRKKKRLNISISKPDTAKQTIESEEDSKEEQNVETTNCSDGVTGKKNTMTGAETDVGQQVAAKKTMPNIVSSRTLEKDEMIKLHILNKREVKEIIGAALTESDLERSLNSNISPDKLSVKLAKEKLSPRKSSEYNRDASNESVLPNDSKEKTTSHSLDNIRPQSKQSFNLSNSRPHSRLSKKSPEKFQLSMNRESLMPNTSPANISPQQETKPEKIVFPKESPIRSCNDFLRSKLTLRKSSCDENKKLVSIQKLGRLFKFRNRVKFLHLGPIKSQLDAPILANDVQTQTSLRLIETSPSLNTKVTLSNAQTQTSPGLDNANHRTGNWHEKLVSGESLSDTQRPGTHSSSVTLSGLEKMESLKDSNTSNAGRATGSSKSKKELDTIDEVNMLSPGQDSQLKDLGTESPLSERVGSPDVNHAIEETEASIRAERGDSSANPVGGMSRQESNRYMEEVKIYADRLIVTDSEDQETPNQNFGTIKRKNDREAEISSSNEETFANIASSSKMHAKINTTGSQHSMKSNKPPLMDSQQKSLHESPKRKRLARDSDNSQKKGKKSQNKASGSNYTDCYASDAETILLGKKATQNGTQSLQDSETSITNSKHKVVRKLQYSQELSLSSNREPGKAGPSSHEVAPEKQRKPAGSSGKKTFQRLRSVSSTDSDSELMEISLTTKPSGSTSSQKTLRPGPSRTTNRGLLLDEEVNVEFSLNRDSPEPKRKRTLSASSLDDVDLHAIASNWCKELDRSSEEIAIESAKVLEVSSGHVVKKQKFEVRDSPASDKAKNRDSVESVEKMQMSRSSSAAKLISDKNNKSSLAIHVESDYPCNYGAKNSIVKNNSKLFENIELGNILNSLVDPDENLTPVESRTCQLSHHSNKENEMDSSAAKNCVEKRKRISGNDGEKIPSSKNLSKPVTMANVAISNNASLSHKGKSADVVTTPFDSCPDQDFLDITQEQIQLQEIEDNLLGRNSSGTNKKKKEIKSANKSVDHDAEVTLRAEKPSTDKVLGRTGKSDAITEPDSDDSVTMNEDIVESTPQKNLPAKKDLQNYADCSQRSTMSRKSFMSVVMTPIPKTFGKHLQRSSEISPLVERNSPRTSVQQLSSSSAGSRRPSCHSTPKPCTSTGLRVNPLVKSSEIEKKKERYCFISSCLTMTEVNIVKAFARVNGAEFTADYKPEVTHLIVKSDESNSASKTLKYLLGIAHKKWIVSYRWVTDSMTQGRLLDEEKYEVVDSDTFEPGAKRSRLSKRGLFEDFAFVCIDPIPKITASRIEDLLTSTGGTIAQSLEELVSTTRDYKIYLYNSDTNDAKKLQNLRQRGEVLPVPFEWVWTCISQYELVSLCSYIEREDRELALDLKYPRELLVEVDESYSENEGSRSDVD